MNRNFLKNIRDNIPEPFKYIIGPVFRYKLIKNPEYIYYRSLLEKQKSLTTEKIKDYQLNQLKNILIYSYENVPYYTKLFNQVKFNPQQLNSFEDIRVIPILTKDIIKENFNEIISKDPIKGGYYVGKTGGSTGEPLKVLHDYDSVFREYAFINYFRQKLGYKDTDKLVSLRGIDFGKKMWKYNPMQRELVFSPFKLSNETVKTYIKKINQYRPDFLNGYLSSIYFLAKLMSDNNIRFKYPIKGIFFASENIDSEQRNFIEDYFETKSITFYGHTERCVIAEEISHNEYQFNPYYGFTETMNIQENRCAIVGTGFLNRTMPLIRYKTDDVCISKEDRYIIDGNRKSTEGLIGIDGQFFAHATVFIRNINLSKGITNYQFVQTQKGKVDLLLVVNNDYKTSETDYLKKEIDKRTKGIIEFNIKIVEKMILTERGKYKMFVNNID